MPAIAVLLASDDTAAGSWMCRGLEAAGAAVEYVPTAQEALARARASRPDLIVVSQSLAVRDGGALLRSLRNDQATRGLAVALVPDDEAGAETAVLAAIERLCHLASRN